MQMYTTVNGFKPTCSFFGDSVELACPVHTHFDNFFFFWRAAKTLTKCFLCVVPKSARRYRRRISSIISHQRGVVSPFHDRTEIEIAVRLAVPAPRRERHGGLRPRRAKVAQ